jgi:hypothetical protein
VTAQPSGDGTRNFQLKILDNVADLTDVYGFIKNSHSISDHPAISMPIIVEKPENPLNQIDLLEKIVRILYQVDPYTAE